MCAVECAARWLRSGRAGEAAVRGWPRAGRQRRHRARPASAANGCLAGVRSRERARRHGDRSHRVSDSRSGGKPGVSVACTLCVDRGCYTDINRSSSHEVSRHHLEAVEARAGRAFCRTCSPGFANVDTSFISTRRRRNTPMEKRSYRGRRSAPSTRISLWCSVATARCSPLPAP